MSGMDRMRTILGVRFSRGTAVEVVNNAIAGGLVVVPSAPVLVRMAESRALRDAVSGADMAITDSGLMVLIWWLLANEKLERVSGLEYLRRLLERPELRKPGALFWVMPTAEARDRNLVWLRAQGFPTTEEDCYVAPIYGTEELRDMELLKILQQRRPAHIVLAVGGGVQERLGFFLKESLADLSPSDSQHSALSTQLPSPSSAYRPGIHCIGAAIGFLTGEQVRIPMWVDYFYLGWLWRSVSAPRQFVPRYWRAWRLVDLMWRYREKAPVR